MANKEFIIEEETAYLEKEGKQFEKDPFDFEIEDYNETEVIEAVEMLFIKLKYDNEISTKLFTELIWIVHSALFDVITVDEMVEQITKIYAKPDIWEALVDCGYYPF